MLIAIADYFPLIRFHFMPQRSNIVIIT